MEKASPPSKATPLSTRVRHSSTLRGKIISEGADDEVTTTLRRILQSQKEASTIEQTVHQIDEALRIFSSKIRHANYLEERQHMYVRKLDQMEKEVYDLKLQQKMRDMERSDKQTIDELLRRTAEYKEESDRFFVLLQDVRKKMTQMDRCLKLLEKENDQLRRDNAHLNRELKVEQLRQKELERTSLADAIDQFLQEKHNETLLIYNFVRDNPCNERFLTELGKFVDGLLKMARARTSTTPERLPTVGSGSMTPGRFRRPKLYSLRKLKKTPIEGF